MLKPDELEYFMMAGETAKKLGYTIKMSDEYIVASPDIRKDILPEIKITLGTEVSVIMPDKLPLFCLTDFIEYNEYMSNAERCTKLVNNLYNNTLAIRI